MLLGAEEPREVLTGASSQLLQGQPHLGLNLKTKALPSALAFPLTGIFALHMMVKSWARVEARSLCGSLGTYGLYPGTHTWVMEPLGLGAAGLCWKPAPTLVESLEGPVMSGSGCPGFRTHLCP